jgi:hypothetical protein
MTFIMPMSLLLISSLPFQSSCARLNSYDLQHHCEKQILFCIPGNSILLLDHLGAFNRDSPKMDTWASDLLLTQSSSYFLFKQIIQIKNVVAAFI